MIGVIKQGSIMFSKRLLVSAFASSLAFSVSAHAGETGLYVGGSVGQSTLKVDDINFDESDTAYKLFVGYMLLPFLGVEGGYVDFGSPNRHYSGAGSVEIETDGWEGYVVGQLPLGPIDLFAKAGVLSYDVNVKTNGPVLGNLSGNDSDEVGAYGAGAAIALGPIKVRGEYTYYDVNHVDDSYLLSVGVTYHF
jgi:OOP family OmpA-OmpF porin